MPQIQLLENGEHQLRRAHWISIAKSDPSLTEPLPRMGHHPANGEPMPLRLPPDERAIKRNGEVVGRFVWSSFSYPGPDWDDDLGVVLVNCAEGQESYVHEIAKRFANEMSAELVLD
ncbi:hypothetical protein Rcae01_00067 [Novipirellula caenicola]|uniref:Uncharacterized protein n=1 Tax=Novipirellula caenicola TaxID=1536901 RepID=A0ABP9VHD4_9BACT